MNHMLVIKSIFLMKNKECNIDTYLHTYEHKNIEKVLEVYKPKKYLIEKDLNKK